MEPSLCYENECTESERVLFHENTGYLGGAYYKVNSISQAELFNALRSVDVMFYFSVMLSQLNIKLGDYGEKVFISEIRKIAGEEKCLFLNSI